MALQIPLPAHGGQLRQIAERFGVPADELLDFSANINPVGPPASVLTAMRRALDDPATLIEYPDVELTDLRRTIAHCIGLSPENIAAANGFVPLLNAALRSLKIKRCLLPVPSFGEYRRGLEDAGVAVIPFHLSQTNGFEYEIEVLREALVVHSCDGILLANPQNPTGALCGAKKMRRLIEMAAAHSATVLLDEAFIDYFPTDSLARLTVESANLIVFRSVTKFFAIPGLRVAYAVAGASKIHALNRFVAPWPVASIASIATCAALPDTVYAEESRAANDRRRRWLEEGLARLNVVTYPSQANFLLMRLPVAVEVTALWERMILDEQMVLRSCANFEGLAAGHLRTSVRSEADNERLIDGLARTISKLAR
jgi:threonine-phosphate decarboxylase